MRPLGATGLDVPVLGLGAGPVGDPALSDAEAGRLLGEALDLGVTLVDTAPSYGLSEERIGRHLAGRRGSFVLSTKLGYGVPAVPDWTGACIAAGVEQALRRLRTDTLDIAHLHSCPLGVLTGTDVVPALLAAVAQGKVRVAAYSGDGAPLTWAVASGAFGSLQASVSVCDQRSLAAVVPEATARGVGVLAKRSLANAAWLDGPAAEGDVAAAAYRERWRAMRLGELGLPAPRLALRFAAFAPGVSCALVGTRRVESLRALAGWAAEGPLPAAVETEVRSRFASLGASWAGMV